MEAALLRLQEEKPSALKKPPEDDYFDAEKVANALQKLQAALQAALPLLEGKLEKLPPKKQTGERSSSSGTKDEKSGGVSVDWLMGLCKTIPSALEPAQMAIAIVEASKLKDETQQQGALFDALGASDQAMEALMEIAPLLSEIRKKISVASVNAFKSSDDDAFGSAVIVDLEEEKRQLLIQEAMDAAEVAAIAKAEYDFLVGGSGSGGAVTHTIVRESEKEAKKYADKAAKRAAQALKRAKDAGAILDDDDMKLLAMDRQNKAAGFGDGGLMNRTQEDLWALQSALLPEGSRQYYDDRGLPKDAIVEDTDTMEKVTIPAKKRDEANLHPRLKISEVIKDRELAKAFEGTKSLNPMQSTTFEVAFHSRDNMLVCAPTGAGKTNVAMLTIAAHFRDAGILGYGSNLGAMEVGQKAIYIAPMKALAQEVVEKFSSKLKPLGLIVRELTGDMQLTRAEAESANVIVTTPEKWDVVTRKSGTEEKSLGNQCGLLIIDEVHLLADERGAVIESVVSRLHRLVESRQRQVRIVALSATLPNYEDVADFLQVPEKGLFYFGPEHRPVPLQQTLIGIRGNTRDRNLKEQRMNDICYDTVLDSLQRGYQVMIFVHSRKGTGDTATAMADIARQENTLERFFVTAGKDGPNGDAYRRYAERVKKSRNRQVGVHFENGMGIHHAGMLRGDRKLTEQMFNDGAIKVLCCTATLAWGINLPAHSVIIKGTEVYNPEKGGVVDLSILDVQQIFGRAGRPQFDSSGEATLITTHDAYQRYINKLVRPVPIESNFTKQLADHLNAEVVGGTVSNVTEAARWLTYTYLYVRMLRNPLAYGINADQKKDDPTLRQRCLELVKDAAKLLDHNQMLRYAPNSGNLSVANNGRVAAHFYIKAESIATFNEMFSHIESPKDEDLCRIVCAANEFENMKLRQEEMDELQTLIANTCPLRVKGAGLDDAGHGLVTSAVDKAFVLLQAYISRAKIKSFTLISDMNYIASNAARVARALFEICLKSEKAGSAVKLLRIAKSVDNQTWWFQTPLRHFGDELSNTVYSSLENDLSKRSYDVFDKALSMLDMQAAEVGAFCKQNKHNGEKIKKFIRMLPKLNLSCTVKPITGSVVRFRIEVITEFRWNSRWHGGAQSFWLWVEDGTNDKIYHNEQIVFTQRTYEEPMVLEFSIPFFGSSSKQYIVRAIADGWVGVEHVLAVPLDDIKIPTDRTPHTDLLNLSPLPTSALQNPKYEELYKKIATFNPIQTQLFHVLYHTDSPVLLGAPTGSGKTIVAELALLRMKSLHPKGICVYIAPLKALARERLKEWQKRLATLNWKVLELSGDTSHDQNVLEHADVLVCTPEKWDLISRGWRRTIDSSNENNKVAAKDFIKRVRLLVLDEVHLLGEERGAVLEAIVSRTRYISRFVEMTEKSSNNEIANIESAEATRIVGLSTALANPKDLADWIGIETQSAGPKALRGLYNFRPSVRPVPTEVHVQGYPGKHYCPRMATMNKPCYAAVRDLSPTKPVLIFVASRRQTRLTAFDIISYAAADETPKMFLHCSENYVEAIAEGIRDEALKHTLAFGIGLHHAGLSSSDRDIVEMMFLKGEIQILVATATLAWGVNLPAHLVIVKGTEYFDGKTSRYVDYPLTDVLQMIGRAGRPGFDTHAQAVVMVAEEKKNFYKRFLYTPFPVESCLDQRLCENLNAEIASGTINSVVEGVGYMTWTFYARRVRGNPDFYGAESNSDDHVSKLLYNVVRQTLSKLKDSGCIRIAGDEDDAAIEPTKLGLASSNYYLQFNTPTQMQLGIREGRKLTAACVDEDTERLEKAKNGKIAVPFTRSSQVDEVSIAWLLYVLCSTREFDEHPVRHNEEFLNEELSAELMWGPDIASVLSGNEDQQYYSMEIFEDPHTKCFLLVQAYLERADLPISDYVNDTKTVIDNIPRLLAAMEFIASDDSDAGSSFELQTQFPRVRQVLEARCRIDSDPLLQLPGLTSHQVEVAKKKKNLSLVELRSKKREDAARTLQEFSRGKKGQSPPIDHTLDSLFSYPLISVDSASISFETEKASGKNVGKLSLSLNINRENGRTKKNRTIDDSGYTLNVIVGSMQQRMLLAHASIRLNRFGNWSIQKDLTFDWSVANADGGADGGKVIVRLLLNEVRGLDFEMFVDLK